jgi:hypothetical protein
LSIHNALSYLTQMGKIVAVPWSSTGSVRITTFSHLVLSIRQRIPAQKLAMSAPNSRNLLVRSASTTRMEPVPMFTTNRDLRQIKGRSDPTGRVVAALGQLLERRHTERVAVALRLYRPHSGSGLRNPCTF